MTHRLVLDSVLCFFLSVCFWTCPTEYSKIWTAHVWAHTHTHTNLFLWLYSLVSLQACDAPSSPVSHREVILGLFILYPYWMILLFSFFHSPNSSSIIAFSWSHFQLFPLPLSIAKPLKEGSFKCKSDCGPLYHPFLPLHWALEWLSKAGRTMSYHIKCSPLPRKPP